MIKPIPYQPKPKQSTESHILSWDTACFSFNTGRGRDRLPLPSLETLYRHRPIFHFNLGLVLWDNIPVELKACGFEYIKIQNCVFLCLKDKRLSIRERTINEIFKIS